MKYKLYPLKFEPILKEKIWGGQKLRTILGKNSNLPNIGESWEVSDVEGNASIVKNGPMAGQSLKTVLENYREALVGEKNFQKFGSKFPLLIKFIDAREDLSIQLHPNDELAAKRHNSFGKTEMWYVMQADDDAKLIVGFNRKVTPGQYLEHLEQKTLTDILNFDSVKEGDTYFIEVGRVHAIGAGVMLAEIQQTSDITYRVYDWDRKDDQGKERELHNDLALDAIGFDMPDDYRVDYDGRKNKTNAMVSCPYFTTNYLKLDKPVQKENRYDSFIIYICVDGAAVIHTDEGDESLEKGDTILMPACVATYQIVSEGATLLEVYV